MGKILDTLKRRDAGHPRPAPPMTASPKLASVQDHPTALKMEPLGDTPQDIPFIEVPEPPGALSTHAPSISTMPTPQSNSISFQPHSKPRETAPANIVPDLVLWHQPESKTALQYRRIADAILGPLKELKARSLLLLLSGESIADFGVIAANLSLALAESQRRVLLIDADVDRSELAPLFGQSRSPGWSDVLMGLPLAQAIQETGSGTLHLMAAGNRLAGSRKPRDGKWLRDRLEEMESSYDLLLISGPPLADSFLSEALAQACDATCLVAEEGDSAQSPARSRQVERLQRDGARLLGSIVIGGTRQSSGAANGG